ncbi:hypothetical protein [Lactococcus phage 712]|uniref:Uncharacterized protein n=1 Tax=Lactococcus phage 712 TaxID=2892346 RepID=Q09WQ4_9CAUD|nr:hypothetical protein LPV712_gp050 [Lactococcus phage 712]ABB77617.1 hypothetical protein [Lactococcus phage 712]
MKMENKEKMKQGKKWDEIDILEYLLTEEEIINIVKILISDEKTNG